MKKLWNRIKYRGGYWGTLMYIRAMGKMLDIISKEKLMPVDWIRYQRDFLWTTKYIVKECKKCTEENREIMVNEILDLQDLWNELIKIGDNLAG